MRRKSQRKKNRRPKLRFGLPDLDQSKSADLGSLRSVESQRGYRHAIDEFSLGEVESEISFNEDNIPLNKSRSV